MLYSSLGLVIRSRITARRRKSVHRRGRDGRRVGSCGLRGLCKGSISNLRGFANISLGQIRLLHG